MGRPAWEKNFESARRTPSGLAVFIFVELGYSKALLVDTPHVGVLACTDSLLLLDTTEALFCFHHGYDSVLDEKTNGPSRQ